MSKPKVFISYSHVDEDPWKNRLQKHLEVLDQRGSLSFWEDRQIAAGAEWYEEIKAALESAEAAILLISVDFLRSKFIRENEVPAILQRRMQEGMKVFPLILRSCPWQGESWLSGLQCRPTDGKPLAQFDKDDDIDLALAKFATEIESLLNRSPAPVISLPKSSPELECPYLGLEAFTEDKQHLFFGRDKFIEAIWQKLQERQFVAVVGPSGSGKSSVVQAGVFPRLGNEWRKLVFQPGDDPFLNVADKFVEAGGKSFRHFSERSKAVEAVAQQIRDHRSIAATVTETLAAQPQPSRLLLVADQFEELFTLTPAPNRQPFAEALLAAAHLTNLKVLVTLRADFFGQAISLTPELSQLIQVGIATHLPLQRADWEAIILQPAKAIGLHVEPGLVSQILEEIEAQPDSLPLLEYALKWIWQQRAQDGIGLAQYESIGKLAGAINQRADAVLAQLSNEEQKLALRALTRLVRVSGGEEEGADTRLRLPLNELTVEQRDVLQSFVNERLLVTKRNNQTGQETIEVAHEALIRRWEKMRGALDSDREFLVWRRRLNMRRNLWEQKARASNWLLSDGEYEDAQHWLKEKKLELTPAEIEYTTWADRPYFQIQCILTKAPDLLPFSYDYIRHGWFTCLVYCGELETALLQINALDELKERTKVMGCLAEALIKTGHTSEALTTIKKAFDATSEINDADSQFQTLAFIAKTAVKAGVIFQLLNATGQIEIPYFRAITLNSIAEALMVEGQVKVAQNTATESLTLIQTIENQGDRISALITGVEALVTTGLLTKALTEVRRLETFYDYPNLLSLISKALLQKGNANTARETALEAFAAARDIDEPELRAGYLCNCSEVLFLGGLGEKARKAAAEAFSAAREIVDDNEDIDLPEIWHSVSSALVKTSPPKAILEMVNTIDDPDYKAYVLGFITTEFIKKKHTELAYEAAREALATAQKIKNSNYSIAWEQLPQSFVTVGFVNEMLSSALEIESGRFRSTVLQRIARELGRAGLTKEALKTAREIDMPFHHASALIALANIEVKNNKANLDENMIIEIESLVCKVYNSTERSTAERKLSILLARLQRYRKAREHADQCLHQDRLAAYTAILREYHIERNPSLAPLFAEEAAEDEDLL